MLPVVLVSSESIVNGLCLLNVSYLGPEFAFRVSHGEFISSPQLLWKAGPGITYQVPDETLRHGEAEHLTSCPTANREQSQV